MIFNHCHYPNPFGESMSNKKLVLLSILLIVFFVILVNVDSIVLQTLSAVLLIMTLIADLSLIFYEVPTNRYRYEVTIDESVTITEIYDNYDVIEQRGDIWILEDKEKK